MLAFIFRGVFLVTVLSWYSTSVWKMIDVYFKNRFQNYLRAEYDKNPHMLADMEAYRAANGKESHPVPTTESIDHLEEVLQACAADVCPVSGEDGLETEELLPVSKEATFAKPIESSQPETVVVIELHAEIEVNESSSTEENPVPIIEETVKKKSETVQPMKAKQHVRLPEGKTDAKKKTTKKKLKTITLTENDFASTRIRFSPEDFAEFDVDEDTLEGVEPEPIGILVSDLPFKPKADIGDLRIVSPEEFCPLTLEEEFSCDETKPWP